MRDARKLLLQLTLTGKASLSVMMPGRFDEKNKPVNCKKGQVFGNNPCRYKQAFSKPGKIDLNLAFAGRARQDIDLVWGAVLTRFISLASYQVKENFLSVGRVQSPTLL